MATILRNRAPSARCYQCGSVHVRAVCHQCGQTMCAKHGTIPRDSSNNPLTKEFVPILGQGKAPYHCAEHDHVVKGGLLPLFWTGVGIAVLGAVLITITTVVGILLLLAGIGIGAGGFLLNRARLAAMRAARPPLPLIPSIESVRINEVVAGRLVLDDRGKYDNPVESVTGELTIATTLGKKDRDRLADYRTHYQLDDDDVEFSAGYAVLDGQMGLDFRDGQQDRPVIPMSGKVSEIPFLGSVGGRPTGQWQINREYELKPTERIEHLPIWLTPSVRAASDKRNLELELQWVDFLPDDVDLELDTITKLVITVPIGWGHIESVNPPDATVGEAGGYIELSRIGPERTGDRRLAVSIQFENEINMSETIRGHLEIAFRNTLSGVRGLTVYHPLGHQRDLDGKKVESSISLTAEFELSLAGIRYQDYRVVPDSKLDQDRDKLETETFRGVIPDYETVVELTDAMSDQGYYVKGVIENPPRSGARASVVNRAWDISGRRYDGVYPVDFHIVLIGEEVHRGDIRAHSGNTTMRLTVQGAYANAEMEEQIEQVWEMLHELVSDTLANRPRSAPEDHATVPDEPEPFGTNTDRSFARRSSAEDRSRRDRLDNAMDALLAGRISEQTYQEIRARIEREPDED